MSWLIQNGVFGEKLAETADTHQLGMAFIGYLIFTLFMTIGAMETNKVLLMILHLLSPTFVKMQLMLLELVQIILMLKDQPLES